MSKKIFFGILLALAILGIVGFVFRKISFRSPIVFLGEPLQITTEDESPRTVGGVVADTIVVEEVSTEPTIKQDTSFYGNKRLIVEEGCRVTPKNIVAQVQEKILIENNSVVDKTISFSGRMYVVQSGGFVIASFTKEGDNTVMCNGRTTDAVVFIR